MSSFTHYNLIGAFGLNVDRLSQMFLCIEASYCFDPDDPNTYHTHVHAADVTLTVRCRCVPGRQMWRSTPVEYTEMKHDRDTCLSCSRSPPRRASTHPLRHVSV